VAAVVAASGIAVYASIEADRVQVLVLALGLAAVAVFGAGLTTAATGTVLAGLAGLAAAWSVSAWTRGSGAPGGTIFAAAALFGAAELAYWSLEQVSVADEPELAAQRLAGLAVRVTGALLLGSVLLASLGLHAGGGVILEAVGVAAAIGLLVLVVILARAGHETVER
jgi:hypothetical protein